MCGAYNSHLASVGDHGLHRVEPLTPVHRSSCQASCPTAIGTRVDYPGARDVGHDVRGLLRAHAWAGRASRVVAWHRQPCPASLGATRPHVVYCGGHLVGSKVVPGDSNEPAGVDAAVLDRRHWPLIDASTEITPRSARRASSVSLRHHGHFATGMSNFGGRGGKLRFGHLYLLGRREAAGRVRGVGGCGHLESTPRRAAASSLRRSGVHGGSRTGHGGPPRRSGARRRRPRPPGREGSRTRVTSAVLRRRPLCSRHRHWSSARKSGCPSPDCLPDPAALSGRNVGQP